MAWRDKRKMKNETAGAIIPAPATSGHTFGQGPQLIDREPHLAGMFVVRLLCALVLLPFLWWIGVFLFDQAGSRNPERALAQLLLLAAAGAPLLYGLVHLFYPFVDRFFTYRERVAEIQERVAQIEAEAKRLTTLAAGAPALPDGRLTEEQKRLFECLAVVMRQAYQDIAGGVAPYPNGNVQRPWSRNAVIDMPPLPRHGKMPERQAIKVREWLELHKVIVGDLQSDQVNTDLYPTWEDFRALLQEEFNMTIRLTLPPGPSPTGLIGRYDNIET